MNIEYNKNGNFRIVYDDNSHSDWQRYDNVIATEKQGKRYIAFSHYWAGCDAFDLVGVHQIVKDA